MKNIVTIMLCLFSLILISCDKDEQEPEKFTVVDFSATNFPQEWKLVASRAAMIPNAKVTKVEGKAESYIFNEDFTFQKKSKIEDETIIAEGTYSIDEREFIILEYLEESDLIASCNRKSKLEYLHFSDSQLINDSWIACDGPYLYYKLVE
jgi:hypothetical protein